MADNKLRKVQLFRTYNLGATTTNIDLGELALNYNPNSPFIMFKDNNGDIQKIGALSSVSGTSEYYTMTQKAITDALSNMKTNNSSQFDKIEESVGLAADGSYIKVTDSNYINDATTVVGAIDSLDDSLKAEETARIAKDNSLQTELDNSQSGVGLAADGSYIKVTNSNYINASTTVVSAIDLLDKALKAEETARIAKDNSLQTELDNSQSGVGLAADGSYIKRTDSNYINDATTVVGAIDSLDEQAKINADAIDAIESFIGSEGGKPVSQQISDAINALDALSVGQSGSYISSVSETDGVISASIKTLVETDDKVLTYTDNGITSTISLAKLTDAEVANLGTNVREAYKLIGKNSEQLGSTIKIYKDQTLADVALVDRNEKNEEGQYLRYTYTITDGSYKQVYVDVSAFLTEAEYGDGLKVVNHVISAKLGEDTATNKNFLDLEGDDDSSKSLAVRSVDTDRTYTTEEITVMGGPLAKLLIDVGINKIDAGTDIQSLLMTLLCKEIYPYNATSDSWYMADEAALGNQKKVSYSTPSFSNTIGAPTISNFSTGTVEAGTKFTFTITVPAVKTANTKSTVSNLTWGYSSTDDDKADTTATTITKNWTSAIASDTYTLKTTVNSGFGGITKENVTGTNTSRPTYSLELQVADGTNKITWNVTGCTYSASLPENPSVYMVSNLGKTDAAIKTNVIASQSLTTTAPTSSTNLSVTGDRQSFAGTKQGTTGITNSMELTSTNVRALGGKGFGNTFSISIPDNTSHVYIALPSDKTLVKVADTGAFGTDIVASFKANTKTNISVEGANGYTAQNYTVYIYAPDALLGANTYDITLK